MRTKIRTQKNVQEIVIWMLLNSISPSALSLWSRSRITTWFLDHRPHTSFNHNRPSLHPKLLRRDRGFVIDPLGAVSLSSMVFCFLYFGSRLFTESPRGFQHLVRRYGLERAVAGCHVKPAYLQYPTMKRPENPWRNDVTRSVESWWTCCKRQKCWAFTKNVNCFCYSIMQLTPPAFNTWTHLRFAPLKCIR